MTAGQRQNNPTWDILRLSDHFITLRLKLGTGQDLEERENPAVQTFCRLMWKCWNGLGNTEKGKRSVVSKVTNNVIDYCRIWCAGRGGGCLPPLQAAGQAEHGQGQLGKTCSGARRSIRPPLPAARLQSWHSSESWNHPCPNPLTHRHLNKQSSLHFPPRSDLQGSAPYGCPNKRHLPTFISPGALTFNPSNIGKSS